jgi:hypothetical protein
MSETPPPFGEEEKKVSTSGDTTAGDSLVVAPVDIDLNDEKVEVVGEEEDEETKKEERNAPSDDLFFSTKSDPEQHSEVRLLGLNSCFPIDISFHHNFIRKFTLYFRK